MIDSRRLRKNQLLVALFQTVLWITRVILGRHFGGPPAWLKRRFLINLLLEFNPQQFIETGTYLGQTTKLVANRFPDVLIDTIEIDRQLFLNAKSYLSSFSPRVRVWHGDSKYILHDVLNSRNCRRVFFWLDGHDSSGFTSVGETETPLLDEMQTIGSYFAKTDKAFLIIIDDSHEISTNPHYPKWQQIEAFAIQHSCKVMTRWNTIVLLKQQH